MYLTLWFQVCIFEAISIDIYVIGKKNVAFSDFFFRAHSHIVNWLKNYDPPFSENAQPQNLKPNIIR